MDIATVTAVIQSLRSAKDLFGAALDLKVDAEVRTKIFSALNMVGEAQDHLRDLREEMFQLQQKNHDLTVKLREADDWKNLANGYELVTTKGGAVVYQFVGNPQHYACPSCFNAKHLHFLQTNRTLSGKYRCTNKDCGAEYPIESHKQPPGPRTREETFGM